MTRRSGTLFVRAFVVGVLLCGAGGAGTALATTPASAVPAAPAVTLQGRLILVAALSDLDLARSFAASLGGGPVSAVRYGDEEFVG